MALLFLAAAEVCRTHSAEGAFDPQGEQKNWNVGM